MGTGVSISLFFIVAVLYIVIIDIFTAFFRSTGMTEEKARFQVISLLTNSGYTTNESEAVTEVLARRKMARTVMLFGYIFSITIVSAFINLILSLPADAAHEVVPVLVVVSAVFVAFLVIKRIPAVKNALNAKLEKAGRKLIYGKQGNTIIYLDEFRRGALVKVELKTVPDALAGKTLGQMQLKEGHGIHIVLVEDAEEAQIQVDDATVLKEGWSIVVFGPFQDIQKVFSNMI